MKTQLLIKSLSLAVVLQLPILSGSMAGTTFFQVGPSEGTIIPKNIFIDVNLSQASLECSLGKYETVPVPTRWSQGKNPGELKVQLAGGRYYKSKWLEDDGACGYQLNIVAYPIVNPGTKDQKILWSKKIMGIVSLAGFYVWPYYLRGHFPELMKIPRLNDVISQMLSPLVITSCPGGGSTDFGTIGPYLEYQFAIRDINSHLGRLLGHDRPDFTFLVPEDHPTFCIPRK